MIRANQAQVAQFLLQKNFLATEKADDVLTVVKRLVALPALDVFLALLPRLKVTDRMQLLADLYNMHRLRHLVQRPGVRNTTQLMLVSDFSLFLTATERQRRQYFNTEFIAWDVAAADIEALAAAIVTAIGAEYRSLEELETHLSTHLIRSLSQTSRGGRVSETTTLELALRWLEANGYAG